MSSKLGQQLATFWSNQTGTQRIFLIALVVAGIVLVPMLISWVNTPSYTTAFAGLSEADAGQIVENLNENGIPFELKGSGTILVPSDKVYEVRLSMARLGLPQGGTTGFELFNGNTLGMTEFTQRVNYQQAIEGELERTIASMSAVEAVRVHIVTPEKSLLSESQVPATASVVIQENAGRPLDASQVRSIAHLVASSVEGLQPENVVVVDVNGNMLAGGASGTSDPTAHTDTYRAAEVAAASEIQNKIQNLLTSVLGPNRSVVQASVSMNWTQIESTTQSYDPENQVVLSSQTVTEEYTTSGGSTGGVPGADPNLPPGGEGEETGEGSSSDYQRTEETVNYEVTQTQTHEILAPGEIERLSLSVLVDGVTDANQLTVLEEAIAAAVGIDSDRGDILTVDSLEFDRSYYEGQAEELAQGDRTNLYMQIGQYVLAGLALAGLLWYVMRVLGNLRVASAQAWTPIMKPVSQLSLASGGNANPQLGTASERARPGAEIGARQSMPQIQSTSPESDQMQRIVSHLSNEDPASLAEVIQLWLDEGESDG